MHGPYPSWLREMNSDPALSLLLVRNPSAWEKEVLQLGIACHSKGTGFVYEAITYVGCASFSTHTKNNMHSGARARLRLCSVSASFAHTSHGVKYSYSFSPLSMPPKSDHLALDHIACCWVNKARPLLWERKGEMAEKERRDGRKDRGGGHAILKTVPTLLGVFIMESAMGECLESGNFATAFGDDIIP